MGWKMNRETSELEPWFPEYRADRWKPMSKFSWLNWRALAASVTAYFMLVLFCAPAFALTGAELDALVPIIIKAESSGNPKAVGDQGKARGLMQIQKNTWARYSNYSWDEAFVPEKNVQVGRAILEDINERYGEYATVPRVLATYNSGRYYFGRVSDFFRYHPNRAYREVFNA